MYDGRHSQRAAVLLASGGAFLAFLDTTIVNIAFPDIAAAFPQASRGGLSWVLDAYFIVIAALLVPAGGLADRLGATRTFLAGTAAFVAASVLCALAPSLEALVAARVLQGAAAAVLVPVSLALVLDAFPPERRAAAVGAWGAAAALAAACGPVLGGVLVEIADWRWIFFVNVPLGAAIVLLGRRRLAAAPGTGGRLPDLAGGAALAVALGLLALGIVEGERWGWASPAQLASFAGAGAGLGIVALRSARHARPVLEPALMRLPSFRRGNVGTLLFAMAFFSVILGNVLFLTTVWGYSVLGAGLAVLPAPLATTLVARPAGRLADRLGHRLVIVPGTLVFAAGVLVLRSAGGEPDWGGTWLPGTLLTGIGVGLAFPALGAAAVRDVPAARFATASAVNAAFRQIGAVLGTALLVAIVGEPAGLAAALASADEAYAFAALAALAAGAAALTLGVQPAPAPEPEPAPA